GEEAMLDLVPLAGTRREVADRNRQPGATGQLLQLPFPQPESRAVAAARVGGHQERRGVRGDGAPHGLPPPPNRARRERGGVVVDADTHPAFIAMEIVDPIRDRLAARGAANHEVVHAHALGRLGRPPGAPANLEGPDELLLFGIDGDGGWPRRCAARTCRAIYRNCTSRSGCRPSRVLTFPCRL